MGSFGQQAGDTQRCAYCGKQMAARLPQCPFCREAVLTVKVSRRSSPSGGHQMRRGLLYMLLAAVISLAAMALLFFCFPCPRR
jgi:hypothetical protein